MTEIERKALVLLKECGFPGGYIDRKWNDNYEALCRAVEQHEAFKREVSDRASEAISIAMKAGFACERGPAISAILSPFILPKPDPLIEALSEIDHAAMRPDECAKELRAALAKHGLKLERIEHE